MNVMNRAAIVIPAYQPDDRLPPYVASLREAGAGKIVIVDDGSGDKYRELFASIPQDDIVHVISYVPNGGKGVALRRGMAWVQDECPQIDFVITADSDGQHTLTDVVRMAESLAENSEGLLLGSRDFDQPDVPFKSRNGNRITSTVFKLLYGVWVSDTQTGLRGFARELLPTMLSVKGDRYEYEMNVLIRCAHDRLPIRALPIQTVYENNNEGTHFRAVRDSARIYGVILAGFFRFIAASVTSFVVDFVCYLLLNNLLRPVAALDGAWQVLLIQMVPRIVIATLAARVISGIVNYNLNKRLVFEDKSSAKKSFPRYLAVFVLNIVLSALLVSTLHKGLKLDDNIIKIPVDLALFFLSYTLQQRWVFVGGKEGDTIHQKG